MKKVIISIVVLASIFLILGITFLLKTQTQEYDICKENYNLNIEEENTSVKMSAIIVKVNENSLIVIQKEGSKSLLRVNFSDEGDIGYKQGQEILIYFDGIIASSYPGQIWEVDKIEIVEEKSNVEIPAYALRYCYNSRDNVNVEVSNLTCNGITLKITDTNELQYDYSHSYKIRKELKNENYTGVRISNRAKYQKLYSRIHTEQVLSTFLKKWM